jgi:AraC-like DNA-binding protein
MIRPRPELRCHIAFFGYWEHVGSAVHRSRALPRGALTLVVDLSGSDDVELFAADGLTRATNSPAVVVGAGRQSYVTGIAPRQTVLTVHFKPAGAAPFLGMPADEVRDRCVAIDALWGRAAIALRARLTDENSAARRIGIAEQFLLSRLTRDAAPHPAVTAALRAVEVNPSLRVTHLLRLSGLPPKRFASEFRTHVGVAPKTYITVRRLQAALARLAAGGELGADIAADLGYFDQSHFVREFRAFTHTTPTEYRDNRSAMPGHVELAR